MTHAWHQDEYFDDGQGFGTAPQSEPTALVLAAEQAGADAASETPQGGPVSDGLGNTTDPGIVYTVDDFTITQLRDAAKKSGLTQRGSKAELVERLNA